MDTSLILIGVGCIVAGIVGGGLKIAGEEFGKIDSLWRQGLLGVFGVVVAGFGLISSGQLNLRALTATSSQSSPVAQAAVSAAVTPLASQAASISPAAGSAGAASRPVQQASVAAPSGTGGNERSRGVAASNVVRTILRMMSHQENPDFARFYADTVKFQGAIIPKSAVINRKAENMQRFPYRAYTPRAVTSRCDATSCTVNAVVDWAPTGGHNGPTGTSEVEFIFTGGHIVAESGRHL
jgi:hypothetical protein